MSKSFKLISALLIVLAAAGCKRLQLDETNFALLCDENLREAARKNGRDPVAMVRSGIGIINNLVASAREVTYTLQNGTRESHVTVATYELVP